MKYPEFLPVIILLLAPLMVLARPAWAVPAPPAITLIAKEAIPAVVDISSIDPVKQGDQEPGDHGSGSVTDPDTPEPDANGSGAGALIVPPKAEQALGTGFFISPDGYIVTNHHVIAGASRIIVTLQNGSVFDAKRVGVDKASDLAVLKVDSDRKFPYLRFGPSKNLVLGDWVVAIGNPFGLGTSVSAGVVSALHRDIGSGDFDDFIQTDAAINRGNSGGPLLNAKGEVVGIDSAIYSPSGGSVGIGFAIPSSMVRPVVEQLIAHGRMDRGWAGVRIEDVSEAMEAAWHLNSTDGVIIGGVVADGPGAGVLRLGDLITAIDGRTVTDSHSFKVAIAELAVGQKAYLIFRRDGAVHQASITIASPKITSGTSAGQKSKPGGSDGKPDHLAALGIDAATHPGGGGVKIVAIGKDSPAARSGLSKEGLIEAVGPVFVTTPSELEKQLAGRKSVSLLIDGPKGPHWVMVDLAPTPAKPPKHAKP